MIKDLITMISPIIINEYIDDPLKLNNLVTDVKQILTQEKECEHLNGSGVIFGDLHGQYDDFCQHVKNLYKLDFDVDFIVFLGDLVDRGPKSIEILIPVFLMKKKYGKLVKFIRGNHEDIEINQRYGFENECRLKFSKDEWEKQYKNINELFKYLPCTCIINNVYFCVHGGIDEKTKIKFRYTDEEKENLMWSDPTECVYTYTENQLQLMPNARGTGVYFNEYVTRQFLENNNLKRILRAHQCVSAGFKKVFDDMVYTIWSAPNYMGSSSKGCVMYIDNLNNEQFIFITDKQLKSRKITVPEPSVSNISFFDTTEIQVVTETKTVKPPTIKYDKFKKMLESKGIRDQSKQPQFITTSTNFISFMNSIEPIQVVHTVETIDDARRNYDLFASMLTSDMYDKL